MTVNFFCVIGCHLSAVVEVFHVSRVWTAAIVRRRQKRIENRATRTSEYVNYANEIGKQQIHVWKSCERKFILHIYTNRCHTPSTTRSKVEIVARENYGNLLNFNRICFLFSSMAFCIVCSSIFQMENQWKFLRRI